MLTSLGENAIVPLAAPWAKAVYHLYVIRVEGRDDLIANLAAESIGTGIHYPIPLHLQKPYGHLGYKAGDFPVSERLAQEIVSLPMYPNLTEEQQHRICAAIKRILSEELATRAGLTVLASS
jgi:dTDP-4-amino-4,6-dideoxygalactose transaminase